MGKVHWDYNTVHSLLCVEILPERIHQGSSSPRMEWPRPQSPSGDNSLCQNFLHRNISPLATVGQVLSWEKLWHSPSVQSGVAWKGKVNFNNGICLRCLFSIQLVVNTTPARWLNSTADRWGHYTYICTRDSARGWEVLHYIIIII